MDENKIGNISTVENDSALGIKSDNSPFATSFYFNDFYDDKAVKKFIKNTEKLIRQSREYKDYLERLHTNVHALNHDNLLFNINTSDVDIEFHHYPFTLYELVEICIVKFMVEGIDFTTFKVAKEVMSWHYKHLIGLVPLTKTMHELAHKGSVFISSRQIFGDYKGFASINDKYLSYDIKENLKNLEEMSVKGIPSDYKGLL